MSLGRVPRSSSQQIASNAVLPPYGLLGASLAWEEGLELNLMGLSAGIDVNDLALRLPGIGRVGVKM